MAASTATAFVDQLDAEWRSITTRSAVRRTLRAWHADPERGHLFDRFASLDDIVDALHRSAPDESDPLLFALIGFAHAGDQVAGRLVLQAFAGVAINVARGSLRAGRDDASDHTADVFGVLAEQIATFPLESHPTGVASHLAFMLRRAMHRRHRRARLDTVSLDWTADSSRSGSAGEWAGDTFAVASTDALTAADRVADVVRDARARGGLDDAQARLLLFVAAGHQVAALARHAGCHRSRMGARLTKATTAVSDFAVAA